MLATLADELRDEPVTHWLVHSASDIGARAARLLREPLEGGGYQVPLFGMADQRTMPGR